MSALIKHRKDADRLALALRAMGWSPSVGTISYDGEKRGYTLGVVVKVGDARFKWAKTERNPMIDFFSIANIANHVSTAMAQKPEGFKWTIAGVDAVQIGPDANEKVDAFINRLRSLPVPSAKSQAEFDFGMATEPQAEPARAVSPARMRM